MSTYIVLKNHIKKSRNKKARVYHIPETTAFSLEDNEFKRLFILSKTSVGNLCRVLHRELAPKCGMQTAIPVEIKVLCALRYFASGCPQKDVAKDATLNISQTAVSRCVVSVSEAICKKLLPNTVSFPHPSQYRDSKKTFIDKTGFPGTIGAIGCSHVRISAPSENNRFLNSDGHHSLCVLFVCDAKMKIIHVDASFPGASMEWYVWKFSKLRSMLKNNWSDGDQDLWLVASDRYQPEPWLLTPFKEPESMSETMYNLCHESSLEVIHRCIYLLKTKFGCLKWVLRVSPAIAERIVKACAVLHNLYIDECIESSLLDADDLDCCVPQNNQSDYFVPVDDGINQVAMEQRQRVVQNYFL